MMPKIRFPALSVYPRVVISRSASDTDDKLYLTQVFDVTQSDDALHSCMHLEVLDASQLSRTVNVTFIISSEVVASDLTF